MAAANQYQDDILYSLNTIVDFPDPVNKRIVRLKASEELLPNLCLGCYFHNIPLNNCMRPHARCCTPDGNYRYIFIDIEHPMQIKVLKQVAKDVKDNNIIKDKGIINIPTGIGLN